ncbi:MAG: hypothetical protein FWD71_09100 [Oscillospiraceae bacterium]|nr:hypothetical protein [Oscillospiraceae bacterium]
MKEKIIKFLLTDEISYFSHFKMIEEYGDKIIYNLTEKQNDWAMSMLIPTKLSVFDIASYPSAEYIVYVAASNDELLRNIVRELPVNCRLVFKISKPNEKEIVMERLNLTFKRSYFSYFADKPINIDCTNVITALEIDESLVPLWLENGYDRKSIEKYFNNGAVSFSVYFDNVPLSTCFIFPSFGDIWEIAALHTIPDERCKGYGKLVAGAALNYIVKMSKKFRYQVLNTNIPSIKLIESFGLQKVLTLEHLYYKGEIL